MMARVGGAGAMARAMVAAQGANGCAGPGAAAGASSAAASSSPADPAAATAAANAQFAPQIDLLLGAASGLNAALLKGVQDVTKEQGEKMGKQLKEVHGLVTGTWT